MLVTQLTNNAGISVWRIVWITTSCCFMQDILGCARIRPASNVPVGNYYFNSSYARNISTQITHSGCLPGRPAILPNSTPMHVGLTDFDSCTVWVLCGDCTCCGYHMSDMSFIELICCSFPCNNSRFILFSPVPRISPMEHVYGGVQTDRLYIHQCHCSRSNKVNTSTWSL